MKKFFLNKFILLLFSCISVMADSSVDLIQYIQSQKLEASFSVFILSESSQNIQVPLKLAEETNQTIFVFVANEKDRETLQAQCVSAKQRNQISFSVLTSSESLPLMSELVNMLVVDEALANKVGEEELQRVLCPGGSLIKIKGGKLQTAIKKIDDNYDDWSHPHKGPDGNMTSKDKHFKNQYQLKWASGTPTGKGGFGSCASTRAVVISNGKLFTVSLDDDGGVSKSQNAVLLARDAFNGLMLWSIDCQEDYGKVELDWRNVWPIAATAEKVVCRINGKLCFVDAHTGKILKEIQTTYPPYKLLVQSGIVVVSCWEKRDFSKGKDGFENDEIRKVWWPNEKGSVEAYDLATGNLLWKKEQSALEIRASSDTIYSLESKGNPPTERSLFSYDLKTGKENWSIPHTSFGDLPDIYLHMITEEKVIITKTRKSPEQATYVLEKSNGKIQFKVPNTTSKNIFENKLWCQNECYDLNDGKLLHSLGVDRVYGGGNGIGGCVPPIVIRDEFYTQSRRGAIHSFNQFKKVETSQLDGVRGACIQGLVPAYGMYFTAQNNCACVQGQYGGLLSIATNFHPMPKVDVSQAMKVETFSKETDGSGGLENIDWSSFRNNSERSNGSGESSPDQIELAWSKKIIDAPAENISLAWDSKFGIKQPLMQPLLIGEQIIVPCVHTGEIICLDKKEGKQAWLTKLPSRIDSSPSLYQNKLFVGCHDGWVYALSLSSGKLIYRVQISFGDYFHMMHGKLTALWPVAGSVLVHQGIGYVVAGKSSKYNEGLILAAFDLKDGKTIWRKMLQSDGAIYRDIFSIKDNELCLSYKRFDLKTGDELPEVQRYIKHYSSIDYSWAGGFTKRSGGGYLMGKQCESMMAWNEQLVAFTTGLVKRESLHLAKPEKNKSKHPDKLKKEDFLWFGSLKPNTPWAKIKTIALSQNKVYYAGHVLKYGTTHLGSFIWSLNQKDGTESQAPIPIPSAPCPDTLVFSKTEVVICLDDGSLCFFKGK